ncbi:MAG: ATP synthase F1 subunit epsilon [Verrucomicrobiales bacterium]|nr:ATP synthase F1 subunit epsilon [Verrucomicrobiales bacterium]
MFAMLKLEIVTPEAKIYSEDVDMVTLPGVEGEMGIYPMHVPLLTQVAAGEVVALKGGQDFHLAIGEGFVQVTGDRVAIMTDMAIKAEDIDEKKAEEARLRAESRLKEKISDEELATVNAALLNSLTQLKVKRGRRPM